MKTLFFECNMGAAGDMLMASLLALHPDPDAFLQSLNGLGIPGVEVRASSKTTCGIVGTHVSVRVHGVAEESLDIPSHDGTEGRPQDHGHPHGSEHPHSHEHPHGHEHPHEHPYGHEHPHAHEQDHEQDHEHPHSHEHPHDHEHPHGHVHHHSHDQHSEPSRVNNAHAAHHAHHGLQEIMHILNGLPVSDTVRENAIAIYRLIAEAEAHAHNVPIAQIHFHEVGSMDAVADIVGVCMLMEALSPERVLCSPIHVGSGHVRCAHGILPVPAPATAHLLHGIPIYGGTIRGELCTPTGAAILKHFVHRFSGMPTLSVSAIGYGVGTKEFEAANCVRAFLGTTQEEAEHIVELSCNIDDMTPEAIGFAQEHLLSAGALDVFTVPIGMKKSRPGVLLSCLCRAEQKEALLTALFRHTTTLGVRETLHNRHVLRREQQTRATPLGDVRVKVASGYGVRRMKPEYEDIARIARAHRLSLADVLRRVRLDEMD